MKSFHLQYVECRNNNNAYISDKKDEFFNLYIIWCKKYNKQCSSKVCLPERKNKNESNDSR